MCSKAKHAQRSHCTYRIRKWAARYFCNYNLTKEERKAMETLWRMRMGGSNIVTDEKE